MKPASLRLKFKIEVLQGLEGLGRLLLKYMNVALRIRDADAFSIKLLFDCLRKVKFDSRNLQN